MTMPIVNANAIWGLSIIANVLIWWALLRNWCWRKNLGIMGMEMISVGFIVSSHYCHFTQGMEWWLEFDRIWVAWAGLMAGVMAAQCLVDHCPPHVWTLFAGYVLICSLGCGEYWFADAAESASGAALLAFRHDANVLYFARKWASIITALYLAYCLYSDPVRTADKENHHARQAQAPAV